MPGLPRPKKPASDWVPPASALNGQAEDDSESELGKPTMYYCSSLTGPPDLLAPIESPPIESPPRRPQPKPDSGIADMAKRHDQVTVQRSRQYRFRRRGKR